jgi:hypothetical protein
LEERYVIKRDWVRLKEIGTSVANVGLDRLRNSFEKFRHSVIHYNSVKEHPDISENAKFGCKML